MFNFPWPTRLLKIQEWLLLSLFFLFAGGLQEPCATMKDLMWDLQHGYVTIEEASDSSREKADLEGMVVRIRPKLFAPKSFKNSSRKSFQPLQLGNGFSHMTFKQVIF